MKLVKVPGEGPQEAYIRVKGKELAWYQQVADARTITLADLIGSCYLRFKGEKGLTKREKIVEAWLLKGLTVEQTAGQMGVTPETVRNFLRSILRKIGLENLQQLAAFRSSRAQADATKAFDAPGVELSGKELAVLKAAVEHRTYEEAAEAIRMGIGRFKRAMRKVCKKLGANNAMRARLLGEQMGAGKRPLPSIPASRAGARRVRRAQPA